MKIAIISDIHDNLWNLAPVIKFVENADFLICCGDLCSPFVIDELAKFPQFVHVVFGNNDADLFRITAKAFRHPRLHLNGEVWGGTFHGRRFFANHFDYLARPIAKSGDYDVVCFGHNHEHEISREGRCLLINPGPIMGAKFPGSGWEDVPPTFVVYDTLSDRAETFVVDSLSKQITRRDTPSVTP